MDLEHDGIAIKASAVTVDHHYDEQDPARFIDTPGHVDFAWCRVR